MYLKACRCNTAGSFVSNFQVDLTIAVWYDKITELVGKETGLNLRYVFHYVAKFLWFSK